MKTLPAILLTLAVAVPATWFATRQLHSGGNTSAPAPSQPAGRKLLFYQSAMHPWIKSDKPGRCTICGMELTPVYEGDASLDATGGSDLVPLTPSMIQVLNVQTAEAQVRPLRKTLQVAGMIDDNATRYRVLSAYIAGRVQKLYLNYVGAEVKEGQPLAEFYSPALLQAEREYRALTGELRAATALRLLQMGLTRAQIEALPQKPGDALTSQILAPIGGTVVAQNVYEGQYVQEGEKLFEIADFSTMWFIFRAYEQDLPWIQPGLKVDITAPSHPGYTYEGRIAFIDPTLDEATRSARARVELANPPAESGHRMLHKIYADGVVHLEAPEVLTVPRTAVIETGPEAVAYVDLGGGAYSRRVLRLGRRGDALVEVVSGLSAGDKVVVNGNLLIDGQAEMNRAFAEPASTSKNKNASSSTLPALTGAQRQAVRDFLALADAITDSLTADNLDAFNAQAAQTLTATPNLLAAFAEDSPWRTLLKPFESAGHLSRADDLKAARKAFYPFSTATVALAQALRRGEKEFAALKVFRCPMTGDAFPGAPNRADWMQTRPAVRNPYFGAEMLECGSEVKP
jgi:Cu(I)/Ag(I) efflux system membrane fusion protein